MSVPASVVTFDGEVVVEVMVVRHREIPSLLLVVMLLVVVVMLLLLVVMLLLLLLLLLLLVRLLLLDASENAETDRTGSILVMILGPGRHHAHRYTLTHTHSRTHALT